MGSGGGLHDWNVEVNTLVYWLNDTNEPGMADALFLNFLVFCSHLRKSYLIFWYGSISATFHCSVIVMGQYDPHMSSGDGGTANKGCLHAVDVE